MTPAERRDLGTWWLSRAEAEVEASAQFSIMARRLAERGTSSELVAMAERAVGDEVRHGELCVELARRYLEQTLPSPEAPVVGEPMFGLAGRELATTLHVVASCCMSESIACGFLRECLGRAEPPEVRAVLREILADEIEHARLGWAYAATLGDGEKREVARAVPALLHAVREAWLATLTPPGLPPGHGSLPRADLERVVSEVIQDVIIPGLSHVAIVQESLGREASGPSGVRERP